MLLATSKLAPRSIDAALTEKLRPRSSNVVRKGPLHYITAVNAVQEHCRRPVFYPASHNTIKSRTWMSALGDVVALPAKDTRISPSSYIEILWRS